jgi:hypothetical protein
LGLALLNLFAAVGHGHALSSSFAAVGHGFALSNSFGAFRFQLLRFGGAGAHRLHGGKQLFSSVYMGGTSVYMGYMQYLHGETWREAFGSSFAVVELLLGRS